MMTRGFLFATFFFNATSCYAVDVSMYTQQRHTRPMSVYVSGLADGLQISNSHMDVYFGKEFYCAPDKLAITTEQSLNILDRYISEHNPDGTDPLSFVMLEAMRETFPCPD